MRQTNLKPMILFALNQGGRMDQLLLGGVGLEPKVLKGVYKGEHEDSYLVEDTIENRKKVQHLARETGQESILLLDNERNAVLYFIDEAFQVCEKVGYFKSVSKFEAEKLESYTFDPSTGVYYAAV